jgi:prophage antirepressor-like protein
MNELKVFKFETKEVRAEIINDVPWFVAKDVCEILEIQNVTQAVQRLDTDERSILNIGRQGDANIINESGLYSLVLTSTKPEAKKFKKWITSEVIPSIRKTGSYSIQIPQTYSEALRLAADQAEQIELMKPKVESFEALQRSDKNMSITNCAKHFGLHPRKEVLPYLRVNNYLTSKDLPTQTAIDRGILIERQTKGADGVYRGQAVVECSMLETWRTVVVPSIKRWLNVNKLAS